MIDRDRAVAFVLDNGDTVERARLRHLLMAEPAPPEVRDPLFAGQRTDGGWPPFWAPGYSSLDATCFRLAEAEQLGLEADVPAVARAARFLCERQGDDGSW